MTYTYFPNTPDRAVDRAAINRADAQHSTGPRTPEGKARSSRNAFGGDYWSGENRAVPNQY